MEPILRWMYLFKVLCFQLNITKPHIPRKCTKLEKAATILYGSHWTVPIYFYRKNGKLSYRSSANVKTNIVSKNTWYKI